jgi:hypothetical protein
MVVSSASERLPQTLSPQQLQFFEREGYLVVDDIFDHEADLQPVFDEYEVVLDRLIRRLHSEGRIDSLLNDLPFGERMTQLALRTGETFSGVFDISLPPTDITPETPFHAGTAVFRLITNERLLDVVEDVIGPEIYSNPVQHVRIKLPAHAVPPDRKKAGVAIDVPWHQDAGVVTEDAEESEILTVWSPLNDATIENGCLVVIPRSKHAGLITHCKDLGIGIPDELLPGEPVAVPVQAGGSLLMHRKTVHSSLPNTTDGIRWSFDLRYQPPGEPTGRAAFPGFLARSSLHPEQVLRDPDAWARLWADARRRLATSTTPVFYRWDSDDPVCA